MSLKIVSGRISRAVKTVIYGTEGVGKSTLASRFPDPLFIDVEGGTSQMDVKRIEAPATWEELLADVAEIAKNPGYCRTLVLDTADLSEGLCVTYICRKYNQKSNESFGYGKGYTYLGEEWSKLMSAFDDVIRAGMNVTVIAHARQRKIELPDQAGAFDHWEMKLSKQVAPVLKEWADLLDQLMREAGISEYQVREIICTKNGFTVETPLEEYPEKVISGCVKHFGKLAEQIIKGEE